MTKRALIVAVLLALVTAPSPAGAFTAAETTCRKTLAANVLKLTSTLLKEQTKCHRARMMGDPAVAPTADCNDPAQLPASSQT